MLGLEHNVSDVFGKHMDRYDLKTARFVCKQPMLGWNGPTALPTRTPKSQLPL